MSIKKNELERRMDDDVKDDYIVDLTFWGDEEDNEQSVKLACNSFFFFLIKQLFYLQYHQRKHLALDNWGFDFLPKLV